MRARSALLLALTVVAGCGGSRAGDDQGSAAPASQVERSLIVDYEVDGESGSVTTALPVASCADAARSGTGSGTFAIPLPGGPAVLRPYDGPGMYEGDVIVDAALRSAQVVVSADGSGVAHLVGATDVTAQWRCVD